MLPLLALAAIPSAIKGISGLVQMGKGKKLAKQNVRPTYEIPKEFQQNVAIAENMAKVGMPSQQYNNALNNIGRNQAGAIRQLGRSGNPSAGLASMLRAGNDATMNLDAQDANSRMNNQRFAFGQRGMMGQQKLAKQNWDKLSLYNEKAAAAEALQGAGRQNTFGALNDLSQLGSMAVMGDQLGNGADNTMGGNFSPNSVNFWGKLLGKNRQTFVGNKAGSTVYGLNPFNGQFSSKFPG